jgi:hypothetical protein
MHQPERARSHSELDRCSPLPTPGQDARSGSSSVLLDRQLEAEAAVRQHLPVRGRRGHLRARHGRNGQGKLHWVRRRHCVFVDSLTYLIDHLFARVSLKCTFCIEIEH